MSMFHFYALLARMRHIGRWGLMHNTFPENVAEHSLMTAVLAHALALIRRDVFGISCDPEACATAALYHDASEIMTGDLPTPVKYWSSSIRDAYREIELHSVDKLLGFLPDELRPAYAGSLCPEGAATREIVHAADKLSAYLKSAAELRAGNTEFESAARQLLQKLKELNMMEIDYFLTNFYPSFALTLDELQ